MRRMASGRLLLVAVAVMILNGCGYALVGHGVTVDPSIKKIGVPLFKDRTSKPGLDARITQEVIEELLKRGHFEVVQERAGVDALVDGEITRYEVLPVGFSGVTASAGATSVPGSTVEISRYKITITAKVRYIKVGTTEPIWSNESFYYSDEYDLGSDPAGLFDRENQARDRLSTAFARNLVGAMLEAF
jgi:Lipopolysaccharide-assembly